MMYSFRLPLTYCFQSQKFLDSKCNHFFFYFCRVQVWKDGRKIFRMSAITPCELKQVIAHLCDYLRQVALRLKNPHFSVIWSRHTQGHCFQLQFQITGNFPFYFRYLDQPCLYIYHLPMQAFKSDKLNLTVIETAPNRSRARMP